MADAELAQVGHELSHAVEVKVGTELQAVGGAQLLRAFTDSASGRLFRSLLAPLRRA